MSPDYAVKSSLIEYQVWLKNPVVKAITTIVWMELPSRKFGSLNFRIFKLLRGNLV